jgi:hypothetical protein
MVRLQIPLELNKPITASSVSLGYPNPVNSVTGLAASSNIVYALFWGDNRFFLAALRQNDLSPLYYQEMPEIKDGHSLLAVDSKLYVVSTGSDEVITYDILSNGVANPKVFWRASASGTDTHHINSITKLGEDIFISAFGPKAGALWSSASNGYIHNITRDIRIKDDIYHPHTLSERHGKLYYCESSTRLFCSLDGPVLKLEGYTRGIGWLSDELVCVCSSVGRKVSKSTGLIANSADPGEEDGRSSMAIKNISNQQVIADVDLSRYGPEMYDVLVLDQG